MAEEQPADPLAPLDLSHLCDGRRTDFPLGMLVETVKVMLNSVYLLEGFDFILGHRHGETWLELGRAARAGDRLVVLRVPARESALSFSEGVDDDVPAYEALPRQVKANISREQWPLVRREVVYPSRAVPETTRYVNLKNGKVEPYRRGERARGPLLPEYDLAGARGKDDTQFRTAPPGAHAP